MLKLVSTFMLLFAMQVVVMAQWTEKSIATTATLTAVSFADKEMGYVVGGNDIFRTKDGGESWDSVYIAAEKVGYEDIIRVDSDTIIAVGFDFASNTAVMTRSTNKGENWKEVEVEPSFVLKSLWFTSPAVGYCSGEAGTMLKTIDGGKTWTSQTTNTFASLNDVYFLNDSVGIAVGGNPISAAILKTTNGGESWASIESPSQNNLQSIYFTNDSIGYIVGWNGAILQTQDAGDTWTALESVSMSGNLDIIFTNDSTGYIVGGSSVESLIQKTTNAGQLWEDISPDVESGLVSIDFPSVETGFAVGFNGIVLKTSTEGVISTATNSPILHTSSVVVFPNPTSDILTIQSENAPIQEVELYNARGEVLQSLSIHTYTTTLDVSDVAPNVYYLGITTERGSEVRRVVKR